MNNKTLKIILAMLLCTGTAGFAQTSSGTFALGGNIGFNGTRTQNSGNDTKYSQYNFGPSLGYFVADNMMVGADLNMSITRYNSDFNGYRQSSVNLSPYFRYYKFTSNEQFAFFGHFGFGFGVGSHKSDGSDPTKSRSFNMHVAPGFTWFPTKRWGIDIWTSILSFNSYDPDKDRDDDKVNSFGMSLTTLSPSLAVRYYFAQ